MKGREAGKLKQRSRQEEKKKREKGGEEDIKNKMEKQENK